GHESALVDRVHEREIFVLLRPALGILALQEREATARLQEEGRDPMLDAGEQSSGGSAVAEAFVADPRRIHVVPGEEDVDGAAEIEDRRDDLVAIGRRVAEEPGVSGASLRLRDRDAYRAKPRVENGVTTHCRLRGAE